MSYVITGMNYADCLSVPHKTALCLWAWFEPLITVPLPDLLLSPPSPQFSLLSEVRGLVTPQDLECFDGMVLRREIQALKARQNKPGSSTLQPDSLSMVSYPDTLTSSSASFMTNTTLSSARVSDPVQSCHWPSVDPLSGGDILTFDLHFHK